MKIQIETFDNSPVSCVKLLNAARVLRLVTMFAGVFLAVNLLQPVSTAAAPAGTVTLSATPTSATITAGQSAAYTIAINRKDYAGYVTLGAAYLPPGATASFSPNPTTGKSSILKITTQTTTPAGTYRLKIGGSAPDISIAAISVTLVVKPASSVKLSVFPDNASIIAGQSVTAEINIARTNYDGAVILAAEDLPDGVYVAFDNNPLYGSKTTMRIYSHGLPHVWKDYIINIKATLRDLDGRIDFVPYRLRVNCGMDWVRQFGSNMPDSRSSDLDRNGDVAVDGSGNIYVAGNTFGTVDPQNPNQGLSDVWLAKYDSAGQQKWIRQLGSTEEDWVTEVVVDNAGNVFIGGSSAGDMPGETNLNNYDFWIAKYDSGGNRLWVIEDGTQQQDGRFGLVIIPDGAGGGKLVTFTAERTEITTYTFNSGGSLSFQSSFLHSFPNTPYDLAVGPNNTIYAVGTFTGLNGSVNEFIVKYDQQGNELWANTFGSAYQKKATRIALDPAGNAYVAGRIEPLPPNFPHPKAWIAKYDGANGSIVWTEYEPSEFFNLNNDVINAVGIDISGDVIIAGMTQGVLGERNGNNATNPGVDDAWLARRKSSDGSLVWVKQFPVSDIDGFDALAFDNNNGIILSGYTVAFQNNIGFEDALLMRYVGVTSGITIALLPSISGFNPTSGAPEQTIRINGANFFGITGVRFNGVPARYTVVSSTQIDTVVPFGATTGLIAISRSCDNFSSPSPFTVTP